MRPESISLENSNARLFYRQEVGKFPLLTAEKEKELGRLISQGQSAEIKLAENNCDDREKSVLEEQRQRGKSALDLMVCSNLRLVESIAHHYSQTWGDNFLPDFIQEGNLGLIRAAETFDYKRGFRFSTHAVLGIKTKIHCFIDSQAGSVSIPVYKAAEILNIKAVKNELRISLNKEPTDQELADKLGIPIEKLTKTMSNLIVTSYGVSLNEFSFPDGEEGQKERGEFICDSEAATPEEEAEKQILKEEILEALKNFSQRDREIIMLHFGIEDDISLSMAEIGKKFGISRERVRQIVEKSLKIMSEKSRIKEWVGIS